MAYAQEYRNDETSSRPARTRPSATSGQFASGHAAGPFEPTASRRAGHDPVQALLTGLLVICPAFAIVAAIAAGFALSGGGA